VEVSRKKAEAADLLSDVSDASQPYGFH
jgi:hypothetical protein